MFLDFRLNTLIVSFSNDIFITFLLQVADEEELKKLRELHNFVYNQACSWFQNLRNKFRTQILQHFGPMPDREENIQVRHHLISIIRCLFLKIKPLLTTTKHENLKKQTTFFPTSMTMRLASCFSYDKQQKAILSLFNCFCREG